jgi:4-diphosphocytidyl-2-C-methyl-D-erythritol kinase
MPDRVSLRSFAKINWSLRVVGRREDGFHELCTIFQTVSLHDTLDFEPSNKLTLTCDDPAIPIDDRNLIIKAARGLESLGMRASARIHLTKRIPSPGGLGGGSSNAATAIRGLMWFFDDGTIPDGKVHELARELGADVPFFFSGGTELATGRGDSFEPGVSQVEEENILIVTPNVQVSTADAFRGLAAPALTSEALESSLTVCRNEAESLDPHHSVLINDFEPTIFAAYPEIKRVKDTLLDLGAANAAMSGSGASVYAVFDNKETRQAAQKALDLEITWRKFAVSTISQSQYREALYS